MHIYIHSHIPTHTHTHAHTLVLSDINKALGSN
jgi:hypothetical protein